MAKTDDFIVLAVLRYADACRPPVALHPDCPFVQSAGSQRTCGQECRAVAASLLRRTPVGVPTAGGSMFDAKQCLLSEKTNEPADAWHVSSLMLIARGSLMSCPYNSDGWRSILRDIHATSSLAFLAYKGFDVEKLVRQGLSSGIKLAIASRLCVEFVNMNRKVTGNSLLEENAGKILQGWLADFEKYVVKIADDPTSVGSLLATSIGFESNDRRRFGSLLDNWLRYAALADIIEWRRGEVEIDFAPETAAQAGEEAIWLVDRFTETYMTKWSQTSVVLEYQYAQGAFRPYLPSDQLSRRSISPEMVNEELARRSVEGRPSAQYMDTMQRQAVSYLEEGRRDAAAGLFEAACILEPQNGEAHNNYGFCLLPDRPLDALKALQKAERLAGANMVNSINQAVGHWLVGEYDVALRVADKAHERGPGDQDQAYLWNYFNSGGEPTVTTFDVTDYLCRFSLKIADQAQDADAIAMWTTRVAAVPAESAE